MSSGHCVFFNQDVLSVFVSSRLYKGGHTAPSVMGETEKVNNLQFDEGPARTEGRVYGKPEGGFLQPRGSGQLPGS